MKRLWIRVPGSCGNVGPGFDVLGLALGLHNELELKKGRGRGLKLRVVGEGAKALAGPDNLVRRALAGLDGWEGVMRNRIPLGRGLGSSGTARLLAEAAALALKGVDWKGALERASEQEGHPDNAAASFYGGLVASRWKEGRVEALRWSPPKGLSAVACVPAFELATSKARKALPAAVPLTDAVANLGALTFLIGAFQKRRFDLLGDALEDRLHQPYRRHLVPGFERVRAAAREAGAAASCLSGAGPTVLALLDDKADPLKVGRAMEKAFRAAGVASRARPLALVERGLELETA